MKRTDRTIATVVIAAAIAGAAVVATSETPSEDDLDSNDQAGVATLGWIDVALVTLIATLISGAQFALNVLISRKNNRSNRTRLIGEALHAFSNNDEMTRTFYELGVCRIHASGLAVRYRR